MRILGIDEAGRGCVLGALVIGGFVADDVSSDDLFAAGAADSKKLSPKRRTAARQALKKLGQADVRTVTATAIDGGNINTLEEIVIAQMVRHWAPDVVRVDALGHPATIPNVVTRLQQLVGPVVRPVWVMEPRADSTYAEVGAASIFAKTTRDELLDDLKAHWGELGSGYPSDPKTRLWLTNWSITGQDWPPFVRTRWGTISKIEGG